MSCHNTARCGPLNALHLSKHTCKHIEPLYSIFFNLKDIQVSQKEEETFHCSTVEYVMSCLCQLCFLRAVRVHNEYRMQTKYVTWHNKHISCSALTKNISYLEKCFTIGYFEINQTCSEHFNVFSLEEKKVTLER